MKFSLRQIFQIVMFVAALFAVLSVWYYRPPKCIPKRIAFSTDGSRIAVQGLANTQVFEVDNGRRLSRLPVKHSDVSDWLEFIDSQHLIIYGRMLGGERGIFWLNVESKSLERKLDFLDPSLVEHFTPTEDGFLVFDNNDYTVRYFSKAIAQRDEIVQFSLEGFMDKVDQGLFNNQFVSDMYFNGKEEVLTGEPRSVGTPTQKLEELMLVKDGIKEKLGAYASCSRRIPNTNDYILISKDKVSRFNGETGQVLWDFDVSSIRIGSVNWSPSMKQMAIQTEKLMGKMGPHKVVMVLDTTSGQRVFHDYIELESVVAVSDQNLLAISTKNDELQIRDFEDGGVVATAVLSGREFSAFLTVGIPVTILLVSWVWPKHRRRT